MKLDWKPSASHETLTERAKIIAKIRQFFTDRGVLEVETPILSSSTVTSPNIDSFITHINHSKKKFYLNTSPEYQMKRLVAAGSGAIFQISRVFRNEPSGTNHHPEFTMLEWYRPSYEIQKLLDEVEDLLSLVLDTRRMDRFTYEFVMNKFAKIDPFEIALRDLVQISTYKGLVGADSMPRDSLLEYIFMMDVEPKLGLENPVAIYDYPASQAALATINPLDDRVANRAEVYYKSIELANGYQELTDSQEQSRRFNLDNISRKKMGKNEIEVDGYLIESLNHMPRCSGIALGLDRLIMLALKVGSIEEVMAFTTKNG